MGVSLGKSGRVDRYASRNQVPAYRLSSLVSNSVQPDIEMFQCRVLRQSVSNSCRPCQTPQWVINSPRHRIGVPSRVGDECCICPCHWPAARIWLSLRCSLTSWLWLFRNLPIALAPRSPIRLCETSSSTSDGWSRRWLIITRILSSSTCRRDQSEWGWPVSDTIYRFYKRKVNHLDDKSSVFLLAEYGA